MSTKYRVHWLRGAIGRVFKTSLHSISLVTIFATLGVTLVALEGASRDKPNAQNASSTTAESTIKGGWGMEALKTTVGEAKNHLQLIPLANACGLGASSCFKCHNGKRAGLASPVAWHTDHAKVNNSCVGCHGGNPRLMKETLAHKNLLLNPLVSPKKYCFGCHQESNNQSLVAKYNDLKMGGE